MGAGTRHEGADDETVVLWLNERRPLIRGLLSATSVTRPALAMGRDGNAPAVEAIDAAALALFESVQADPCPDPVMTGRMEMVAARCRFAVLEIRLGSERRDEGRLRTTAHRLKALNGELEEFLAVSSGV